MRVLTHKLAPLLFALCALATTARPQEREYAEPPNLKLTLSVEKTAWLSGESAPVKVRIENATGGRFQIPSTISFNADNRLHDDDGLVTMSHGVFRSPVSLTKTYSGGAGVCQSDLTPDRVENIQGKVLVIRPAKDQLILEKGEAKEFSFDLAATCWGHSVQAFYPSDTIFEAARCFKTNTYRVYFRMQFPMRTGKPGVPRFYQLKSNAVEVAIN